MAVIRYKFDMHHSILRDRHHVTHCLLAWVGYWGNTARTAIQNLISKSFIQGHISTGSAMIYAIYMCGIPWAAWYNTWFLVKLTPKGVVFSFLCVA